MKYVGLFEIVDGNDKWNWVTEASRKLSMPNEIAEEYFKRVGADGCRYTYVEVEVDDNENIS